MSDTPRTDAIPAMDSFMLAQGYKDFAAISNLLAANHLLRELAKELERELTERNVRKSVVSSARILDCLEQLENEMHGVRLTMESIKGALGGSDDTNPTGVAADTVLGLAFGENWYASGATAVYLLRKDWKEAER